MIRFRCPGCDGAIEMEDTAAGSVVRCPECDKKVRVAAGRGGVSAGPVGRRDPEGRRPRHDRDFEPREVRRRGGGVPLWVWAVAGGGLLVMLVGMVIIGALIARTAALQPGREYPEPGFGDQTVADEPNPRPPTPPPADLKPRADDPAARRVYLSDLKPFDLGRAPIMWKYGKNGWLGSPPPGRRIAARGWASEKGIGMHPPERQPSRMKFRIPESEWFESWGGLDDSSPGSQGELVFEVRGDDKVLWRSKPIRDSGRFEECRVSVRGVKVLELRVYPPPDSIIPPHGGHAVWLDPYVTRR